MSALSATSTPWFRVFVGCVAAFGFVLLGERAVLAASWVETAIIAHHTDVGVERGGTATVHQLLTLRVRGGPLTYFDVQGVPTGIEVLPDAALRRADSGNELLYPLDVKSTDEGTLRLSIQSERGVRGGTYLFDFSYRAPLGELLGPKAVEGGTGLSYVGPRLPNGVDAAQVTFSLPHAVLEPKPWTDGDESAALVLAKGVQREGETDRIELVRAHVAVSEPAVWKIIVDREVVPVQAEKEALVPLETGKRNLERAMIREGLDIGEIAGSLALAVLFALFLREKSRRYAAACAGSGVTPRPLVPLRGIGRALLGGVAAFAMVYGAFRHETWVTAAGGTLALALATELWPVRRRSARGPGQWEAFDDARLTALLSRKKETKNSPFDLGNWVGMIFALALVAGISFVALRVLSRSPYWTMMSFVFAAPLVPLFLTGKKSDLPEEPGLVAKKWGSYFSRRFPELEVSIWGRLPLGDLSRADELEPDEVRLRLKLPRTPRGLRALEIGFEEGTRGVVRPCLLLRVLADSEAEGLVGASADWTRGRTMEEKVLVLRPESASPEEIRAMTQRLLKRLTSSSEKPSAISASSKSSGRGARTLKPKLDRPVPVV